MAGGGGVSAHKIPKGDGSSEGFFWILASDKSHEATPEFSSFSCEEPHPVADSKSLSQQRYPPAQARGVIHPQSRQQHSAFNAPPPPGVARMLDMPLWLSELLSFRRAPTTTNPVPLTVPNVGRVEKSQHLLAYTLLKTIKLIQKKGEIRSKVLLSQQAPNNELKDLVHSATLLAQDAFEALPPNLACISPEDLAAARFMPCELEETNSSHSLPHSAIQLPSGATSSCFQSFMPTPVCGGTMSAPLPSSSHLGNCFGTDLPPGFDVGFYQPPPFPPPASGGFPSGAFHHSNFTRSSAGSCIRRLHHGSRPLEGIYSSPQSQMKKYPTVGDRPLTPPAHGWHAKYSSGVTGVVWDRVHQAWVVSWTLAGKRTFRHFTCKSYGGFDKAREAAIEFRLARNREIAAYNKRTKDRR